jgi:hypothetical protein
VSVWTADSLICLVEFSSFRLLEILLRKTWLLFARTRYLKSTNKSELTEIKFTKCRLRMEKYRQLKSRVLKTSTLKSKVKEEYRPTLLLYGLKCLNVK